MFKKICIFGLLFLVSLSFTLSAEIDYVIEDIGTLQTKSSEALALNNQGQILGWYNIDGSEQGKHFFVRDSDGTFHEIPSKLEEPLNDIRIVWRYLTDIGNAYGFLNIKDDFPLLFKWDRQNGLVNLGNLPGKEIATINNKGQVLIKSVSEIKNGKSYSNPVIWENGKLTKLNGLVGNVGIESEESEGFSMNNKGEVVGRSTVYINYKNNIYKQIHAAKWLNGQAIDLHTQVPKAEKTVAIAIKDNGEFLIDCYDNGSKYLVGKNKVVKTFNHTRDRINNAGYSYGTQFVFDIDDNIHFWCTGLNEQLKKDYNSPWLKVKKIISVNDKGEIIAQGETIYGEQHAILLIPKK